MADTNDFKAELEWYYPVPGEGNKRIDFTQKIKKNKYDWMTYKAGIRNKKTVEEVRKRKKEDDTEPEQEDILDTFLDFHFIANLDYEYSWVFSELPDEAFHEISSLTRFVKDEYVVRQYVHYCLEMLPAMEEFRNEMARQVEAEYSNNSPKQETADWFRRFLLHYQAQWAALSPGFEDYGYIHATEAPSEDVPEEVAEGVSELIGLLRDKQENRNKQFPATVVERVLAKIDVEYAARSVMLKCLSAMVSEEYDAIDTRYRKAHMYITALKTDESLDFIDQWHDEAVSGFQKNVTAYFMHTQLPVNHSSRGLSYGAGTSDEADRLIRKMRSLVKNCSKSALRKYKEDASKCFGIMKTTHIKCFSFSGTYDATEDKIIRYLNLKGASDDRNKAIAALMRDVFPAYKMAAYKQAVCNTGMLSRVARKPEVDKRQYNGTTLHILDKDIDAKIPAATINIQYSCCERKMLSGLNILGNTVKTAGFIVIKKKPCVDCRSIIALARKNNIDVVVYYTAKGKLKKY